MRESVNEAEYRMAMSKLSDRLWLYNYQRECRFAEYRRAWSGEYVREPFAYERRLGSTPAEVIRFPGPGAA